VVVLDMFRLVGVEAPSLVVGGLIEEINLQMVTVILVSV
jgi:hypothetical protein